MNIKNIKYQMLGLLACMSPLALTGCADWDDHYDGTGSDSASGQTLWQEMLAKPELSDFCQVLQETKVFRQHKKTSVSYADLLDGVQAFTVVAPVNGSFNRDSLLQLVQTSNGDSLVEHFFVFNHLSRRVGSLTPEPKTLHMLNEKNMPFENNEIGGVEVALANQPSKNGVMHIVKQPLPYYYNIYEALCQLPDINDAGAALSRYNKDEFDATASTYSHLFEGVPVYVDSVINEYNTMTWSIGYVEREDSNYWAVVPTNEGWKKAWAEAQQYFKYDKSVLKRDSIQHYWTTHALLSDAVYNANVQTAYSDSLFSVQYNRLRPEYHVFYKPFEAGGILNGAERMECSNGVLFKTQEWPFTPEQTYFREIKVEGEDSWLVTAEKDCSYISRHVVGDSISEGAYLEVLPLTGNADWELTYRIDGTLSGDYDICAIILPKTVVVQQNPDMLPNKFRATINYVDTLGKAQTFKCKVGKTSEFTNNPEVVDTVLLAEAFHFPACNYGQNEVKVSIKLACDISKKEQSSYTREMYLDCIYLRPRTSKSE